MHSLNSASSSFRLQQTMRHKTNIELFLTNSINCKKNFGINYMRKDLCRCFSNQQMWFIVQRLFCSKKIMEIWQDFEPNKIEIFRNLSYKNYGASKALMFSIVLIHF